MKYTIVLLILFSSSLTMPVKKRTIRRDSITNQRIIDMDEFAEMKRKYEKRRSMEQELELEQERQRTNLMTKCIDFSKVVIVLATSLIGLIINGVR